MSISNSKRILYIISIVIIVIVANALLFILYKERAQSNYFAAIYDKEIRLKNINSPKIIFVGGSNMAFGIDSAKIESSTKYSVVNMGLEGGLGIEFQLNQIKPYINNGDIIIISPEFENFTGAIPSGEIITQLLIVDPSQLRYISTFQQLSRVIMSLPSVHVNAIKNMINNYISNGCLLCVNEQIYFRGAFNKYGDVIVASTYKIKSINDGLTIDVPADEKQMYKMVNLLNDFLEYSKNKNAKVAIIYPTTINRIDEKTKEYLNLLNTTLIKELNIPVWGNPEFYQYNEKYMFDTAYHLNASGKEINTNKLINLLCSRIISQCQ